MAKAWPKIAVVGCGTVGGSCAKLLIEDSSFLREKTGLSLEVKYVVDVNFGHAEKIGLPENLFETDLKKVLADDDVGIVVELIGGTTTAYDVFKEALSAQKHVVTANKALLAHHGSELFALARENGVSIGFEASCGGGIPIIRALLDGVVGNRIDALFGIVNGTCNYILTQMINEGQTYDAALADAQEDGLAEADPTLDVTGMDSAHKIAIMASLAFGKNVRLDDVTTEGIDTLELFDVKTGADLGYVVKLLAVAQNFENGINTRIMPVFISMEHPLAWISGPFNAVSVYGHAVGHTMYYGRGAGGSPTASAIISDIIQVAAGITQIQFDSLNVWPDKTEPARILPMEQIRNRYYIRVTVEDKPNVLSKISSILGGCGISISSVLQPEVSQDSDHETGVPVIITTHTAAFGDVRRALDEVDALEFVKAPSKCIHILDEHPERLSG